MYKYILIFFVGIFTINSTNAQWRRLIAAQTYGFATNPQNSKTIFVGGIDRKLYRSFDGGISWDTLSVGFVSDGPKITNIFIHPIDTSIIIVGGIGLGTIQRSTDGGNTWKIVSTWPDPISMPSETIINDVHNSDIIYAADKDTKVLFRSTDKGATWDSISKVPAFAVCTLMMLPNSSIMFAGGEGGLILKSLDAGIKWKKVAQIVKTSSINSVEIPRIVFSQRHPSIGYAVSTFFDYTQGQTMGGLYRTIDSGNTWNLLSFADTSLWSVAVHTLGNEDELFIGGYTDLTVFPRIIYGFRLVSRSQNSGLTWELANQSVQWTSYPYRNVWMMKFEADQNGKEQLFMATEAGFFVLDSPSAINDDVQETPTTQLKAKLTNGKLTIELPVNFNESLFTIRLFSILGLKIFEEKAIRGKYEFMVESCPLGIYFCEIVAPTNRLQQLIINQ